jgi:hypothetical protein
MLAPIIEAIDGLAENPQDLLAVRNSKGPPKNFGESERETTGLFIKFQIRLKL